MLAQQILSLTVMHLLIFIIPGPNVALVIRNSLKYGFKIGMFSAIGITAAITLHAGFSIIATKVLITVFHQYFYEIKIIGLIYLVRVGFVFIKNAVMSSEPSAIMAMGFNKGSLNISSTLSFEKIPTLSGAARTGFFLDLFNPYIALFYISVCPSYLNNASPFYSLLIFGSMVAILNFTWFIGLAYLVSCSHKYIHYKLTVQYLELISGTAMLIFALFLFLKA